MQFVHRQSLWLQFSRKPRLLILQRPLQLNHPRPHFFHVWVEPQGPAERFQRGDEIVLHLVRFAHHGGRLEVVGIDLERLVTIAGRGVVLAEVKVGLAALEPTLGDPGSVLNDLARQHRRAVVVAVVKLLADGAQPPLMNRQTDPIPDQPNGVFRERSDAAIQIDHRPAEHRIRLIIAQPSQGQNGAPPSHPLAVQRDPFERTDKVTLRCQSQELGDVMVVEVLFEKIDQQRTLAKIVTHGNFRCKRRRMVRPRSLVVANGRAINRGRYGQCNCNLHLLNENVKKGQMPFAPLLTRPPRQLLRAPTRIRLQRSELMSYRSARSRLCSTQWMRAASSMLLIAVVTFARSAHSVESKATRQLAKPVSITWQQVPLSTALERLAQTQSLAVWQDRRVDPSVPITLTTADQPLSDVLAALTEQSGAAVAPFAGVVYIGPQQTAEELATLAALVRQPLAKAPSAARTKWLKLQAWNIPRLSEPRRLLNELAAAADAKVQNEELVPHDLWPARKLPALAAIDRAVLLLAGFDLTCRLSPDGSQLEVTPIDRPVVIAQEYRVPPARSDAFNAAVAEMSGATATGEGSRPTIAARIEDHERLRSVLSGRPTGAVAAVAAMRSAGEKATGSSLEDRRFTLTIENKPLAPVLNQLATQLNLQLEWDAAISDDDRNALASCQVAKTDLDGLLQALLEPAGLTFDRQESRVYIKQP